MKKIQVKIKTLRELIIETINKKLDEGFHIEYDFNPKYDKKESMVLLMLGEIMKNLTLGRDTIRVQKAADKLFIK